MRKLYPTVILSSVFSSIVAWLLGLGTQKKKARFLTVYAVIGENYTPNSGRLKHHSRSRNALLFMLLLSGWASGQSIFTNPITGTNPNTSNPYTTGQTVNANITVSGIGRGSGITGQNVNNAYSASGWNSSSINFNDYYEFTLTPNSCYYINFSSFTYTSALSSGSANYAFRSSIDNYASDIATYTTNAGSTIDLSGLSFQNITSSITFRLYCWNANSSSRTFRINDFSFTGSVNNAVPVFSTQPISATVCQNASVTPVSIVASAGGGTISMYQWYSNASNSNTGGTAISGANWLSYYPSSSSAGTTYYYCTVTNSLGCSTSSNAAYLTVTPQPSGNFAYSAAGFCNSISTPQEIATSNLIGTGTYSSTSGLTINASTGAITPSTSTANSSSYTVTYTVPASSGCSAYSSTTSVRIDAQGTGSISYPATICTSSSTPVSPTITGAGGTGSSTWVLGSPSGMAINGNGDITPSSSTPGTYTATYYRSASGYCPEYSTSTSVTIGTAPTITSTTPGSRCGSGTVSLAATSSGGTIEWYSASSGGSAIGTGTSFTTPSISSTTTYYVQATTAGCGNSARTAVVATINSNPTISASTPASRCGTGTVVLSATPSAGTVNWYAASSGGSSIGSGTSFTTPSISSTTTYYAEAVNGACVSSSRTAVIATITAAPSITSTTPASRCGNGTITLTAATSIGTISWYAASSGGSALATGTSYTTPSLSTTTTYYVESNSGSCSSGARVAVAATVNTLPIVTSSVAGNRCGTGTVNLSASVSVGSANWYATSTGGTSLGSGLTFTTPSISSTTTYYVEASNNGCPSNLRVGVIATINTIPTATGSTVSRCGTGTVTLTASASAGTINWYAASTGGTSLGTGTSFITPSISSNTTYYVDATSGSCTSTSRTAAYAVINAIPTITATTPASRCSTGTVSLGATASAGTINWYAAATGGSSLGTGTTFTTPSISTTTTYYVDATASSCTSTSRTAVVATVNANPTVTATTPGSNCGTGTVTLGATASAGTLSWFAAASGGSALGTGTSFTTPSIASTTTYYVSATNGSCTSPTRSSVIATINIRPTISSSTPGSRCGTGTVLLGAASATTINWFDALTGGSSLASGTSFTTPSIATTTTYYAEANNGTCTSASRTAVVATVNSFPTITSTTPGSRCGTGTVALSAVASTGSVKWYAAATGGTALATATSYTTPSIAATTSYYVDATSAAGCVSTSRTEVIATVNPNPTVTATTPGSNCGTGAVVIGATPSAGTISWYTASSGGTSIGSGTSFTTPSISSTTTYYAQAVNGACVSATRSAVIATINPIPSISSSTGASRCGTGTLTLSATAATGTINWYAASSGGTSLGTGTSFTTPSISSTTTYYVGTSTATCSSPRIAVVATINTNPTVTISSNYCSNGGLVVLSATAGLTSYSWSTGESTQIIDVDQAGYYTVTATNAQGCSGTASVPVATELVTNGTFTAGNTGFTTAYSYRADIAGQLELYPEGTYGIVPNANTMHTAFNGKDRYYGTGNIMVINGSPQLGATVWSQNNISVLPNTTYYFSAWAMSVVNGNNAILQFSINGNQIGTVANLPNGYSNANGPYNWVRFYGQWNSGPSTSANLSIVNLNTILGGNDFAMDDISFGTLSPAALTLTPTINGNGAVCVNSPLILNANALGGASPFIYAWTGPNGFTSSQANPVITQTASATNNGTYSVTVTDGFGCQISGSVAVTVSPLPVVQSLTASASTICSGSSTSIQVNDTEADVYYQLINNSTDENIGLEVQGTGSSILLPTNTITSATTYRVVATRYTSDCSVQMASTVTVNVAVMPVLVITNQAACSGTVNLTATAVTAGSTGLGTLTYWTNAAATSAISNPAAVASSGTYYIKSTNGSCYDIEPVVVSISASPTGNFSYPTSPYCSSEADPTPTFSGSSIAGVFSSTSGLVFLSTSTGKIDLSASTPGTYTVTNRITPGGACSVVTATSSITITGSPNPNFTYVSNDLCQSVNAANVAPIFEAGAVAGTFSSSAGLSFVSTSTGVINVSASTPGNYAVVNSLAASGGCSATSDTFFVDINPYIFTGSLTSSSSDDIICNGEEVDLYASATSYQTVLLRERFNGSFSNWVTSNTSTGGTPANAAFTLQADNYSYSGNTFRSNDQSKFYLTNSQAQGSGGTTNTVLRSPMMSSVGFSSLSLDFFHYFNYRASGDVAKVQVSTNNTSWTDIATYTSSQGSLTGFTNAVVNLNSYIGLPSLYIRFVYTASNDRYWAIDNVSITGASTNYTYDWESSPSGFSSTLQNPTNLTPELSRFYVVTATNSYGCSVPTIPVPVTVNPTPEDHAGVDKIICGAGGVTIGETAIAGSTYSWSPATNLSNETSSNPTASPLSTTTYTLTETITETGCFTTSSMVVSMTALPEISESTPADRCGPGTLTLSASSSTGVVKWYSAATGGTLLASTESYTTPSLSTTTTYYADASTAGCSAASRTPVTATVNAPPTIVSQITPGASYSQNAVATALSVTANAGSGTIESYQWYSSTTASNASGTILFTANSASYVPSTVVSGTLYYYCLVTNSNGCTVKSAISGAIVTLVTPSITSVIPTLPLVSEQSNNTGYRGQRITINGANFVSNSTVSYNGVTATSVVFVNSGQLTAIVNNSGVNSTGNVVVTNPSTGANSSAPFSYIGYYTASNGDWNTPAVWLGATLPTALSNATVAHTNTSNTAVSASLNKVTIRVGATLTLGATASSISTLDFDLQGNLVWTSTGSLTIGNQFTLGLLGQLTPGNGTIVYNKSGDQLLFTGRDELTFNTVTLSGSGVKSLNSENNITVKNLTIMEGSTFSLAAGGHEVQVSGNLTVNGNMEPGYSDFHIIGTGDQTISVLGTGTAIFSSLNVNKASGALLLNDNVQVRDTLEMTRGNINTQGNTLEIGLDELNTGIIKYTSGYVTGKLRRWYGAKTNSGTLSGIFPIGQYINNSWKNRNVNLNYTVAPSTAGHITIEFIAEPMINGSIGTQTLIPSSSTGGAGFEITNFSDDGYWKIDNLSSTLIDGEYTISLTGEGFLSLQNSLSQLTIVKRVNGGNWFCPGQHNTATGDLSLPTLSRSGISGFSNFGYAGGATNVLPISLVSFDAKCDGSTVTVKWSTASESNNKEFLIEESDDAIFWKTTKTIPGAGNSNTNKNYATTVETSYFGGSYFRLKQIDYNGDFETFDPVYVNCEKKVKNEVKIYPNPAIDYANVEISSSDDMEVLLTLFSNSGQILLSQTVQLSTGVNTVKLDITSLPVGAYHLNLSNDRKIEITGSRSIIKR